MPRALRNGVYVVFANMPWDRPGIIIDGRVWPGHGHSVVIAPDGTLLAAAREEADRLLVATVDVARASRAEAIRQHSHPLFRRFWDVGVKIMQGGQVDVPAFEPLVSPTATITVAAAQMACSRQVEANLATMERLLQEGSMWFEVKGVPAVVTIGGDALWSEIAELAAVRGAQLHFHLCYDQDTSEVGRLRRKQLWVNLASYRNLTVAVNALSPHSLPQPSAAACGGSIIWQDFGRASSGEAGGYVPHSAVRLAEAGIGEEVIHARQAVPSVNRQFELMTQRRNPQMRPWYVVGAQAIYDEA